MNSARGGGTLRGPLNKEDDMVTVHNNATDEDLDSATQGVILCSKTLKHLPVFQ